MSGADPRRRAPVFLGAATPAVIVFHALRLKHGMKFLASQKRYLGT